jgi:hypothetical protein
MRRLLNLLYGGQPARFVSALSLPESVARLREVVRPTAFHALFKQCAVGRVTERRVSMRRVIPFVSNSFAPEFVGRFENDGPRVILTGRFDVARWVQVFMTLWLAFIGLAFILSMASAFSHLVEDWWVPLIPGGMFLFGIGMVWLGRWLSRKDADWLSNVISESLGSGPGSIAEAPYRPIE